MSNAMTKKDYAAELQAMGAIMEALTPLERGAQIGVLGWVLDRLDLGLSVTGKKEGPEEEGSLDQQEERSAVPQKRAGNINTVVSKLGSDSCRTLLIAAAVHLTLFQGKDFFSRTELVALARSAKVWKDDYANQTSTMIGRLADAVVLGQKGSKTTMVWTKRRTCFTNAQF